MAKKKKQKKVGLAKRKTNKQHKKQAQKRKLQANKPVQKKISASKIKQNLKNLPSLIFEPELRGMIFSETAVTEAIASHDKEPDQIEAVADEAWMNKLKIQLEEMKARYDREREVNKSMMVHALIYYMEQESAPAYLNQIAVSFFFETKHNIENPDEPIDLKSLNQLLKDYDNKWSDYLQEKVELLDDSAGLLGGEDDEDTDMSGDLELAPSEFEPLISEFETYLADDDSLDDDTRERSVEDVEVLINDYFESKGISQLSDMRARKIRSFIENWFIRNMHPTQEDLELMVDSLTRFYQFVSKTEKIDSEESDAILGLLQDKESLLENVEL